MNDIGDIIFEDSGNYITAVKGNGDVIIRCNFRYTDCGETETLLSFVKRHGGLSKTVKYLREAYDKHTSLKRQQ